MRFILRTLKIGTQKDIDFALQEVKEFVLVWVHFPFIAYARKFHGEDTDVTTIELYRQEID